MATSSFFNHSTVPTTSSTDNADAVYTLGVSFAATTAGQITSVWYYVGDTNSGGVTGTAAIYAGYASGVAANPSPLGTQAFTFQGTVGWQEITFSTPVNISAGGFGSGQTFYVAAIFLNGAHYATQASYYTSQITAGS